jgi:hypothetical protein
VIFLATVLWASNAPGITLSWGASPTADVVGYTVHYGTASRNYTQSVDAGAQTFCTITDLNVGTTYYFAVTARSNDGLESVPSNEVSYTVPETPTQSPRITSLTKTAQGARLRWTSLPGMSYRVVYKQDLRATQWLNASPLLVATGTSLEWIDSGASASNRRFYAVVMFPTAATSAATGVYISRLTVTPQGPRLEWMGASGKTYRVVYKNNLNDTQWLDGSFIIVGSDELMQWVDTTAFSATQRFYSVMSL